MFLRTFLTPAKSKERSALFLRLKSAVGFVSSGINLRCLIRNQLRNLANGNGLSLFPHVLVVRWKNSGN